MVPKIPPRQLLIARAALYLHRRTNIFQVRFKFVHRRELLRTVITLPVPRTLHQKMIPQLHYRHLSPFKEEVARRSTLGAGTATLASLTLGTPAATLSLTRTTVTLMHRLIQHSLHLGILELDKLEVRIMRAVRTPLLLRGGARSYPLLLPLLLQGHLAKLTYHRLAGVAVLNVQGDSFA